MNHLGEYWWIALLYCVVIVVAGCIYTWKIRSLRNTCDISQKRINSLEEILDARNRENDRLRQENNKLMKLMDDRYGSPTTMILPPTVVDCSHRVIVAELVVPLNAPDRFSGENIGNELMKRLAPEIQKCWSVATENDIVQNVRHYRATLHVLSR